MTSPLRIAVLGAAGRMGQAVAALAADDARYDVVSCWRHGSDDLDQVLSGVALAIDFTHVSAIPEIAAACASAGAALVSGTTGLDDTADTALTELARAVPVLHDGNMSLGVHVLLALARMAASALPDYDIEISETHHRDKRDAPSGTALKIGEAVASIRGIDSTPSERFSSDDARASTEIGYAVRRGGRVVGEHTLALLGEYDRLEIHHAASDRRLFADGALKAALWLADRPAGRYAMADIFGAI